MGTGIALHFLRNNHNVILYDISRDALTRARDYIEKILKEENKTYNLLIASDLESAIRDSDVVFEAIIEDVNAKRQLYKQILAVQNNIPIASNTSTFMVKQLTEGLDGKESILIAHWMNPPDIIPIVEVAVGEYTRHDFKDLIVSLLRDTGKIVVEVPDIPGLIVNRINRAVYREALRLHFIHGIDIEDIDKVMKYHLGIIYSTTGLFKTIDYIGLDTFLSSAQSISQNELTEEDLQIASKLADMIMKNKLGVKTGEGFYKYSSQDMFSHIMERNRKLKEVLKCLKDRRL